MTDKEIVNRIAGHVGFDTRSTWYVGIAADAEDCLFSRHGVDKINGNWIWQRALNSAHARSAETLLLNAGFSGGPGGGDESTVCVYAYKKTPQTRD